MTQFEITKQNHRVKLEKLRMRMLAEQRVLHWVDACDAMIDRAA
jgi:hypothetical protein